MASRCAASRTSDCLTLCEEEPSLSLRAFPVLLCKKTSACTATSMLVPFLDLIPHGLRWSVQAHPASVVLQCTGCLCNLRGLDAGTDKSAAQARAHMYKNTGEDFCAGTCAPGQATPPGTSDYSRRWTRRLNLTEAVVQATQ
eukprot:3113201-Amphidinium_carterae.1